MNVFVMCSVAMVSFFMYIHYVSSVSFSLKEENDTLNLVRFINGHGYPVEVHKVTTEDGYILTTFRIPSNGKALPQSGRENNKTDTDKPVILLMHGLFSSAYEYVCNGPNKSLGLLLVDRGYDVWLANARGTIFSRNHERLNPDRDTEFWQYSWNEIGMYDLPANIDYILNVTGNKQLSYVGTSQGTTVFWVMASEKPEYNKRIKMMIALAPVAYLYHVKGYAKELVKHLQFFKWLAPKMGLNELYPKPIKQGMRMAIRIFCKNGSIFQDFCIALTMSFIDTGGWKYFHFDKKMFPTVLKFGLTGACAKQLLHFGQLVKSDTFEKYDYGREINLRMYNSETPPKYNLSRIDAPVGLFYGEADIYAEQPDIDRLKNELSNVALDYKIPYKEFNHFDYIVAKGAVEVLYNKIFELLSSV